jgi:cell division protein FtsA
MAKKQIITGLDLGTSHIKILIAEKNPESGQLEILGSTELPSFGIRRGVVVNIKEVSKKISEALSQLEQQTGIKINDVYVNVNGTHLSSVLSRGTVIVSRADEKISKEDVDRVIQAAQSFALPSNKEILDIYPQEFIVDGQGQIKEPQDMRGIRLEVEVLALCGFSPYIKNLSSAVLEAGPQISDIIPSPLASARAVLTPQQKELGVCLIDIGAGTTNMAVYEEGNLIHIAVFPVGSDHITNDIAVCLKTDVDIAEKIKHEFGTCIWKGGDKKEKIALCKTAENSETLVFSRKMLVKIVEARVLEIFGFIQKELKQIKTQGQLPAGVVITGGGAKLPKTIELAKKELKLPCRLGYASGLTGLERNLLWSSAAGLILGEEESRGERSSAGGSISSGKVIFSKIKRIFKIFIP